MTHDKTDRDCELCALVDIAIECDTGLADIPDLPNAKAVLTRIALRFEPMIVLKRILLSEFREDLLLHVPNVYGFSSLPLKQILEGIYKLGYDPDGFRHSTVRSFADAYWYIAARERIKGNDYARAWDIIKASWHPIIQDVRERERGPVRRIGEGSNPTAASVECIQLLVNELYAAMQAKNIVGDILDAPIPEVTHRKGRAFSPAGIAFAIAVRGYEDYRFKSYGLQIVQIAAWASKQVKKKRAKKTRRQLESAAAGA